MSIRMPYEERICDPNNRSCFAGFFGVDFDSDDLYFDQRITRKRRCHIRRTGFRSIRELCGIGIAETQERHFLYGRIDACVGGGL